MGHVARGLTVDLDQLVAHSKSTVSSRWTYNIYGLENKKNIMYTLKETYMRFEVEHVFEIHSKTSKNIFLKNLGHFLDPNLLPKTLIIVRKL